jgi:hypothetical protein
MSSDIAPVSKKALWTGYIMSILPVLMLLMGAVMSFLQPLEVIEGMEHVGYPAHLALPLGIVELACAIVYVIPRTSVLGAILLTGYLGGAVATHVRIGEVQFIIPIVVGILVWGGLFLRDRRIRALIPLRK